MGGERGPKSDENAGEPPDGQLPWNSPNAAICAALSGAPPAEPPPPAAPASRHQVGACYSRGASTDHSGGCGWSQGKSGESRSSNWSCEAELRPSGPGGQSQSSGQISSAPAMVEIDKSAHSTVAASGQSSSAQSTVESDHNAHPTIVSEGSISLPKIKQILALELSSVFFKIVLNSDEVFVGHGMVLVLALVPKIKVASSIEEGKSS